MHLLLPLTGLAGAALCLAVRLPGPVRCWGPHAIALAVMPLMAVGCAPTAMRAVAVAVALAAAWTALAGSPGERARGAVDLAAMALITACASAPAAMPRMPMGAAPALGRPLCLLLIACWAAARTAVPLAPLLTGRPPVPARGRLLGGLGSGAMIISMAAMLG
ncbi:hypothetical protein [Streptacidiphilus sp. P02-A3a]|uniref:hypothetical protein n=1 Tax=Streptacidiphilus sp. P02-A3a TaxID=2704468 RepID=UPI0015F91ABA|nr:hypothetical protein [Streptacidiphilus sp. P02-A3a]QMU71346.1 hypothetical protein GXP74_27060 [Streptacidiphilus sp. P02-A3a]